MAEGSTPLKALEIARKEGSTQEQRERFLANARQDAILGATAKSQKSVRSGVRCWMSFVGPLLQAAALRFASMCCLFSDTYDPLLRRYFPPPIRLLVPWTTLFRSPGTLQNYLGHVKTGCILAGKPIQVSCHTSRYQLGSVFAARFSNTQSLSRQKRQ